MTKLLDNIVNLILQTQAQKNETMVGFGCVAVLLMLLCIDKCKFSNKQKWLLLAFMAVFLTVFFVLYFVAFK